MFEQTNFDLHGVNYTVVFAQIQLLGGSGAHTKTAFIDQQ